MITEIENIKLQILELSKRYNDITGAGHSSDVSSLREISMLMDEKEMTNGCDSKENRNGSDVNMRVIVESDKNGHYYGLLNGTKCNFLSFSNQKEAKKALHQFRGSPDCFVQPICVVDYKTKSYLAVESFEIMKLNQDPSDERNNCLKNILKLAINLDLTAQFNDGFDKLIMVSGRPKLCTLCDITVGVQKQACELAKLMKKIVKTGCYDDKFRIDFFQKLDAAYTITHLRNCFYHPLLMTRAERAFFHPRCMLLIQFSYARINHKDKLSSPWHRPDPNARPKQAGPTWNALVKGSGYEGLKATLNYQYYGTSKFEWHRFVRNAFQHVNDNALSNNTDIPYGDLYDMMTDLDNLFPELLSEMHSYMIETDLYREFERQGSRNNTVMMTIHAEMERLTSHLPEIPFDGFLHLIDMFDFILAKISMYCGEPGVMESIRNRMRNDKKKVDGIRGNTLSDVTIQLKNNKKASAALYSLRRYLVFFSECVLQLEGSSSTLPIQNVVHIAIRTKCDKTDTLSREVSSCKLPDRNVVDKILQFTSVSTKERNEFAGKASRLGAELLKEW